MYKEAPVKLKWAKGAASAVKVCYQGLSKFKGDNDAQKGTWRIVIEFEEPVSFKKPMKGTARFLVDEAPHENLKKGVSFELHNSLKKLADVEVLTNGKWFAGSLPS